tara:strand:- start:795 stop:1643 length:849 start_codon:yes stop_codon:yes gene_type:complete
VSGYKLKHLDLFSGIGGFSLGLETTGGFETVAFCDYDSYCQKVLRKHWPWVTIYDDIKELNYEKLKSNGHTKIDIITGGYPCQPFSIAGRQQGEKDPRHVWPEMFRLIQELRPTWVIGENVSGHVKLGLDTVLENLESEGYSARTFSISASSIGANHQRERIWTVANSGCSWGSRSKFQGKNENEVRKENANQFERSSSSSQSDVVYSDSERLEKWESIGENFSQEYQTLIGADWWSTEPNVGRVANGVPKRVDRLKSLGNSLVPHIPYCIGMSILQNTLEV